MKTHQATVPSVEGWAAKSSMAVKAVMDWSNDPTIGGDIASIIIERGKKWRWFSRLRRKLTTQIDSRAIATGANCWWLV
jgi:hypothetical protein